MSEARDRLRALGKLPSIFDLIDEEELCPSCHIRRKSDYPHPCPYNDAMGGMLKECQCCKDCERDCKQSI